ncbi:MAG: adenosylmethionine-8-amino-7-oxononanoate aminotransferase, partial [Deltaproteobacteria bacterium]|nr:adenosylmethionine-8-amino-7-oxononanoate aminotransferase [Deltaproteobacteria bacterium]
MNDMTTALLQEYDRNFVWHPFTQMKEWECGTHPVIVRGEGS